jgi:hypothetical protein
MAKTCYQSGVAMRQQTQREMDAAMKYKRTGKSKIYWTNAALGVMVGACFSAIAIIPNLSNPNFTPRIMLLNFVMFTSACGAATAVALKLHGEEALHNASIDEIKASLLQMTPDQLRQEFQDLTHEINTMARGSSLGSFIAQAPQMDAQPAQTHTQQGVHAYGQFRDIPASGPVPSVQSSDGRWLNLPD